jgi:RNA polymerase sigma factor (sigma-70 family)
MDPGDDDLLAGIAAGEPNWAELYKRHGDAMHNTARRFIRKENAARGGVSAEDIVQQAMSEMMGAGLPTTLASMSKVRSYFVTVVFRRAYDTVTRNPGLGTPLPEPEAPGELPADDHAQEAVEDQLLADQAKALMPLLPERERYVIEQHIMRARTQQDVGAELGVSDGRIRQLLTAGLRRLRALIGTLER